MRLLLPLLVLVPVSLCWSQQPATPDPQVGSLYPFIDALAPKAPLPLSFLNPRFHDLESWKRQARAEFQSLLHYDPPRCDMKPEVLERVDCGDYIREKIAFNTTPLFRVPAYVLIPKGGPARRPAILLLHDHGAFFVWGKEKVIKLEGEHPALAEFRRLYYGNRGVGNELVKRGYVVMAIDMIYWGERRMFMSTDPPAWRDPKQMTSEDVVAFNRRASNGTTLFGTGMFEAGTTWAGVMFTDDRRSLDYLCSRPEVDPNRVGCCGLSVGGFRSAHLAGLDPRIKGAVVVGWMCSYPTMLRNQLTTIGFWATVPGLQQRMDLPDVASMACPNALMCIHGTQDRLFTNEGVQAAFDTISGVYAKAGYRSRFRGVTFDGPHEFNAAMQDQAFEWLDRWVKGR